MTTTINNQIQEHIHKVEDRMRAASDEQHPELRLAMEHLLSSGGKRIRPMVVLLTGGMLRADLERLITLAAAVELLHTATLVHDDLIDGSLLRRGSPTLNAQWTPAATVLTGDYIFARAAKLASETESIAVMKLFAHTLETIVNGEITQLFDSRGLASREDYFRRIHAKTASMFELAAGAAALLSPLEGREQAVDRVCRFGYEIGMAFQIVDDILDFTGQQTVIGKPIASDLRQGLVTLPALYYMEKNPEDPDLLAMLNGRRHAEERLNRLVSSIRQSGSIQQAMDEARRFVKRGLAILQALPDNPERYALEDLASFIVKRRL